MEQFSFTNLYKILNSQEWYNTASEIEILKGYYEKISNWKDVYKKGVRKIKYKRRK